MNKRIRQFLLKIFLLGLLTLGTVELLYQFNPFQKKDLETSYTAAILDKYERLHQLKSPKIVLIAGSNFAYGINSEMIEKAFNKPVVNMAMHYDYGTDFMLRQIEPELHRGDTVIMGFEYIVKSEGNMGEKIQMAKLFPKAKEWFSYKNILEYISENAKVRVSTMRLIIERTFSDEIVTPSNEDTTSIFFRKGINKYGDLKSHFNNPSLKEMPRAIIHDSISLKEPIKDMNLFYDKMKVKNIQVFYTYPSFAESSYKLDKYKIDRLVGEFNASASFPILGKPSDFVFPDSLCQDMVYHLNVKGRDIRTHRLIELLNDKMK